MGHEESATSHPEMTADLSEIELNDFRRLVDGADSKQVAADLGLSEAQVHAHERTIFDKLRVKERSDEAVDHVRTHGHPPPIRTHPVRWIVLEVILLVVLGLAALYWFNNLTDVTVEDVDGRRTWIIQPGDTVRLSSNEVGPDDWYRCEGKGGLIGTPEPDHVGESVGLVVETASDGTVTLYCEPGPPPGAY